MGRTSDARQRLIEAARSLIFTRSYETVSVDELCSSAGVHKSSFYHFFSSKQQLVLTAIEAQWQWFEQTTLGPLFSGQLPPHEQILLFFDLTMERQQTFKQTGGFMVGCPAGNLTLEMSTRNESIRARVEQFFQAWLSYFELALEKARAIGSVPNNLDIAATAQALLAYFEGVMLLAKGRNDPALFHEMRMGVLALMQYQEDACQ